MKAKTNSGFSVEGSDPKVACERASSSNLKHIVRYACSNPYLHALGSIVFVLNDISSNIIFDAVHALSDDRRRKRLADTDSTSSSLTMNPPRDSPLSDNSVNAGLLSRG